MDPTPPYETLPTPPAQDISEIAPALPPSEPSPAVSETTPQLPQSKPTIKINPIVSAMASALLVGGLVYAYQISVQHKLEQRYRQQITAIQDELNQAHIALFAHQHKSSSATWSTFASGGYSFEYPSLAVLVNPDFGTFNADNVVYGIQMFASEPTDTISIWMQRNNIKGASTYTPLTVNGHTAYRSSTELATYLLAGNQVYFIYAKDGVNLSTSTADNTYAHLLSTFKIGATK